MAIGRVERFARERVVYDFGRVHRARRQKRDAHRLVERNALECVEGLVRGHFAGDADANVERRGDARGRRGSVRVVDSRAGESGERDTHNHLEIKNERHKFLRLTGSNFTPVKLPETKGFVPLPLRLFGVFTAA